MNIINRFLPEHCYFRENTPKKRICLHHTVSSPFSIDGDIAAWSAARSVATHYIIAGDGTVYNCIPQNFWAHHLGTKLPNNAQLNRETIGIEIDAWGILKKEGDRYITAYGKPMDANLPVETIGIPFRGSIYYQQYLDPQITALQLLLYTLSSDHNIPLSGLNKSLNFELLADFTPPGIYSHSNFRPDKSDVYPSKKLISMLKSL